MTQKNPSERGFWWLDAACRGLDPDIWFPEKPQGRDYFAVARSYCNHCDVREECLAEAMAQHPDNDRFGMFGGKSPRERQRLRSGRTEKAVIPPKTPKIDLPAAPRRNKVEYQRNIPQKATMTQKQNEIPKQTRLVMDVTRTIPASPLTAQAAAALIMAGWEDPIQPRTAAALFMGASYVGNLAHEGVEAGILTPQESAAIQGVVELAMQVWKFHAVNGTINENA
jgi:WhiB family redox-sensing transcriptional regulator